MKRAIRDLYTEDTDGQKSLELERLDDMLRVLVRVALSKHRALASKGKLILDEQGQPVYDDATNVQAALAVVKLSESRRKLLGLDAPAKSRVHVITEDVVDAESNGNRGSTPHAVPSIRNRPDLPTYPRAHGCGEGNFAPESRHF